MILATNLRSWKRYEVTKENFENEFTYSQRVNRSTK